MGFSIMFSLRGKACRMHPDLLEREIFAIGYVGVQWSFLEHLILLETTDLAYKAKEKFPDEAISLSFKRRLRCWRDLIKRKAPTKSQERLLGLASRIGSIERSRHRITHGIWEWEAKRPDKLRASSIRPPHEFDEPFDFDKLIGIGEKIGELCFEILYPKGREQAWKDVIKARTKGGSYVSREARLMLTGKGHLLPPALRTEPPEDPEAKAFIERLKSVAGQFVPPPSARKSKR